jgi:hypothetical protein
VTRLLTSARRNAIAYLALFVALGGTSYAALSLPAGSVGTRQLRNGAVTPRKLDPRLIGGTVRAWARVSAAGHEVSGSGMNGAGRVKGTPSQYSVLLNVRNVRGCAASASVIEDPHAPATSDVAPGSAVVVFGPPLRKGFPAAVGVETFDGSGQPATLPFVVEVLC